jgi:long-chain fatty acid transport protein
MRRFFQTAVLWALGWFAQDARAGGFYLPDRGVRAFSRGGAFVASCDDLSALWYNPAALAGQHGTRVHLDSGLIFYGLDFQRYTVPEVGVDYAPVSNQAPPLPDPSLAVSSDFGLSRFVFALGAYGPYTGLARFPEDGAQRYSLIRADNFGALLAAAAAWEPLPGLRLGVAPTLVSLRINNTLAASSFPGIFGGPEEPDQDGVVQFVASDDFVPTVVAGLWLAPGEWLGALRGLEIGFSFMAGVSFDARGELRSRLPDHLYWDGVTMDPETPRVSTRFRFPWVVRGGVRYADAGQRFDAELAVVFEDWSVFDVIEVETLEPAYYRNVPTIGDYRVLPLRLERHYRDTLSVRLGGSYRLLPWLWLRAGAYRENGASPDVYYSVAAADTGKWGLSFGAGVVLGAFEIDLGYLHVFADDRDIPVSESRAMQTNPSNPEGSVSIGGGRYRSAYDVLGLSILARVL